MTGTAVSGLAPAEAARVLIVDDEAVHVTALCDVLRSQGYDVDGRTSGPEALTLLSERPRDVLMTDLFMPDMDGMTLIRQAQNLDPDLVGIIMTGQGSIESAVEALKGGADDYVSKPLQLRVVMAVLRRALALRRLRIDNRALVARLRERTLELEAANTELEAFSYSVSHDLRAPLRAVRGFHELLELDYAERWPCEAREHLRQIGAGVERMNALIDDMLKLAQLGRSPAEKQPVDVQCLVSELIGAMTIEARGTPPRVEVGTLPPAHGNPRLLEQVFANLLSNAFKFSRSAAQPQIWLDSVLTDEGLAYRVRDNGVGFSMPDGKRLFAPFQRLHAASEFEGTGVGLSIVRRIVHQHGGRIWAESQPGKGATFYFTLPARR